MTDSEWLHYRDLKSRCPACKRPAHIAKRDETFYFVDDEYNPFVRHAPVKNDGSGIPIFRKRLPSRTWDGAGGHGEPEAVGTRYPFRHGSSAHKNRFREAMRMDDCGSEKTIHYEEEGTQDGAKA